MTAKMLFEFRANDKTSLKIDFSYRQSIIVHKISIIWTSFNHSQRSNSSSQQFNQSSTPDDQFESIGNQKVDEPKEENSELRSKTVVIAK